MTIVPFCNMNGMRAVAGMSSASTGELCNPPVSTARLGRMDSRWRKRWQLVELALNREMCPLAPDISKVDYQIVEVFPAECRNSIVAHRARSHFVGIR